MEASDIRVELLEIMKEKKKAVNLTEAEIIVSGGRGVKVRKGLG